MGDVTRLRQILVNLLSNADQVHRCRQSINHSDLDSRKMTVMKYSSQSEIQALAFPAERMDCLFQSFSQVDMSNTRKYGGTGLWSGHKQTARGNDGGKDMGRERSLE